MDKLKNCWVPFLLKSFPWEPVRDKFRDKARIHPRFVEKNSTSGNWKGDRPIVPNNDATSSMLLTAFEWPFTQYVEQTRRRLICRSTGNVFREPREEQQKFAFVWMHWWKTYDRFFFSPPFLFHVSDSEIVSGDNFFDALDNGVVVCRLARVIQEKARTAIDAGRAKGVSNSFSLSASTFENWMRISIDRNVEVRFYLISFLHFLLIIVINSIEN